MTDGVAAGGSHRRVTVLWNPNAGSKGGLSTNSASRDELLELMERHGLGRELVETGSTDDLIATARRAVAERYDAIVAAGGDGTVSAVARELLGTGALGMTFAPEARMNDGCFDVRVFSRFSRWRILRHLASIALGRKVHTHEVTTFRSSRVAVTGSHPVPCRADAEDLGTTPVTLVTRPGALRVLVPVGHVGTLPTRQAAA